VLTVDSGTSALTHTTHLDGVQAIGDRGGKNDAVSPTAERDARVGNSPARVSANWASDMVMVTGARQETGEDSRSGGLTVSTAVVGTNVNSLRAIPPAR
jgi:hypothetical protein